MLRLHQHGAGRGNEGGRETGGGRGNGGGRGTGAGRISGVELVSACLESQLVPKGPGCGVEVK